MYQFPYTDFHDLDLDWVINEVKAARAQASDAESLMDKFSPGTQTVPPTGLPDDAGEYYKDLYANINASMAGSIADAAYWADQAESAASAANTAAANIANIGAVVFSVDESYSPGYLVYYSGDGKIYRLPMGHTAGTSWANTIKNVTTPGSEIWSLASRINNERLGTWELGGINNNTGATYDNTARARTDDFIPIQEIYSISCAADLTISLKCYNADGQYAAGSTVAGWTNNKSGFTSDQLLTLINRLASMDTPFYVTKVKVMASYRSNADIEDITDIAAKVLIVSCNSYSSVHDQINALAASVSSDISTLATDLGKHIYSKRLSDMGYVENNTVDLDNVTEDGFYVIDSALTVTNAPEGFRPSLITVQNFSVNRHGTGFVYQEIRTLSVNDVYCRLSQTNGTWWAWRHLTATEVINYNYSNYYPINNVENTYNITSSPAITSTTENYLAPSGDTTDRTSDIATLLTSTGICRLGAGDYYVTDLVMPAGTTIEGAGYATRVILASSVLDGAAIEMKSKCAVRNLQVYGQAPANSGQATIGTRKGISWTSDYDPEDSITHISHGIINNVWVQNFAGSGIICNATGGNMNDILMVSNVYIYYCDCGLNIPYVSEYHRFTNVSSTSCYYGCQCNAGNCIFVNCSFGGNNIGLIMDNRNNQSPNNSHGAFIGCSFNHLKPSNTGRAIELRKMEAGEIFSGCQIFFGTIYIENSEGIRFNGCSFGKQVPITVKDSTVVTFDGCTLYSAAQNGVTEEGTNIALAFNNCYYRDGTQPGT